MKTYFFVLAIITAFGATFGLFAPKMISSVSDEQFFIGLAAAFLLPAVIAFAVKIWSRPRRASLS